MNSVGAARQQNSDNDGMVGSRLRVFRDFRSGIMSTIRIRLKEGIGVAFPLEKLHIQNDKSPVCRIVLCVGSGVS